MIPEEGKDMNTTEDVYETMMNGGEIQKQIERIKGYEWIKVIEGGIFIHDTGDEDGTHTIAFGNWWAAMATWVRP